MPLGFTIEKRVRAPRRALVLLTWLAVSGAVLPVAAHHSFSGEWDRTNPVSLRGVVSRVDWINPHIEFTVDVRDRKGRVTTWTLSGAAPGGLERRGILPTTIKVGDDVKVEGFRALDGATRAACWSVSFTDGRKPNRIFPGPLEDPSLP